MEHLYYILLNLTRQEWLFIATLALALLIVVELSIHKKEVKENRLQSVLLQAKSLLATLIYPTILYIFLFSLFISIFLCEKPNKSYKIDRDGQYSQAFQEHIRKVVNINSSTLGFMLCNLSNYKGEKCSEYISYLEARALMFD